jgi:hypothetical protein
LVGTFDAGRRAVDAGFFEPIYSLFHEPILPTCGFRCNSEAEPCNQGDTSVPDENIRPSKHGATRHLVNRIGGTARIGGERLVPEHTFKQLACVISGSGTDGVVDVGHKVAIAGAGNGTLNSRGKGALACTAEIGSTV